MIAIGTIRLGYEQVRGTTPLFVAAALGHEDIVRYLVQQGAKVDAVTSKNKRGHLSKLTPLHGAVRFFQGIYNTGRWSKQASIIRFLVQECPTLSATY